MSKTRKTRRAKVSPSYRWEIEQGEKFDSIAEMIGKASGHVFDGVPSQMIGTAQRSSGRILGVKATYGPRQTVTMRIRKDNSYSISFGLRLVTKVGK